MEEIYPRNEGESGFNPTNKRRKGGGRGRGDERMGGVNWRGKHVYRQTEKLMSEGMEIALDTSWN